MKHNIDKLLNNDYLTPQQEMHVLRSINYCIKNVRRKQRTVFQLTFTPLKAKTVDRNWPFEFIANNKAHLKEEMYKYILYSMVFVHSRYVEDKNIINEIDFLLTKGKTIPDNEFKTYMDFKDKSHIEVPYSDQIHIQSLFKAFTLMQQHGIYT